MTRLDLNADVVALTTALVDISSVSGHEAEIADAVETALAPYKHLDVMRDGDAVVARTVASEGSTSEGRSQRERVVVAGHLDTVPAADNAVARRDGSRLYGLGSCDMKGGVAVALRLAATLPDPSRDVTYVFYDCEEVDQARNGLARLSRSHPEWLEADFAVLMEPSNAGVEGGCQGSLRIDVITRGRRAHSARSWRGHNAIHDAEDILARLVSYEARTIDVDGLGYREGLNAVGITGGVAGNVIPDECRVSVNFRFAPDRTPEQALGHVREVFDGYEIEVTDSSPAARPGLDRPAAAAFVAAVGKQPQAKFGWTDVALFSALGVPAVNYGPGDPSLAHAPDEHVEVAEIIECEEKMRAWLSG